MRHRRREVIPSELLHKGFGVLSDSTEFPAHFRRYLANQIVTAYNAGALGKVGCEKHTTAIKLHHALKAEWLPMLEALTLHTGLEGAELTQAIKLMSAVIPAMKERSAGDLSGWVERQVN